MGAPLTTYTGPVCPVTKNNPATMTLGMFKVQCLKSQGSNILCKECAGSVLPYGLTIIEPPVATPKQSEQKVEKLPRSKVRDYEKDKCEFCGEMRSVKDHKGRIVCTTCQYVRTTAGKRPHVLLAALIELYSAEEMQGMFSEMMTEEAHG